MRSNVTTYFAYIAYVADLEAKVWHLAYGALHYGFLLVWVSMYIVAVHEPLVCGMSLWRRRKNVD